MSVLSPRQAKELPALQVATILLTECEDVLQGIHDYQRPLSLPAATFPLLDEHYERMRSVLGLIESLRSSLVQKESPFGHEPNEQGEETAISNTELRVPESTEKINSLEEQLAGLRNFNAALKDNADLFNVRNTPQ